MTRTLNRPCLGCGKQVRGKPRCRDCQANLDKVKRAKRPDLNNHHERERRRRLVADHRANLGDWCPGLEDHPAHPSADLVADHVVEVAISGLATGPLRVLCRQENSRRSARILTTALAHHPSPAEVSDTLRTRAAPGGRVKAGPLLGELPQELAEDVSSLLPKLVLACGALRTSERQHQPRTQVEQTDDEVGWTRSARVGFELGDVVDCPLSVLLQPQAQALDGDSGASACGVGLIHGARICR
jgi:hypothetical protein